MPAAIRLGDTSSHGGEVVTAAVKYSIFRKRIARKTDILRCPIHGDQPIIEGSAKYNFEGQGVARHGDQAACGATLVASQSKYNFE
ncbi:PAAR domain-containing protein [Ahrensia sp. R2A130]|uniref:PAAR domain-containing protein n=1 Tax=Ahrensia sp. R2A130 TaxID=744979 RepID=UPI0001E0B503|nr:PAAR domain-containing protein [Ahrensia sp. R2A130]EFL88273.1 paar repeat-containing protein [Ahrensia sp. R2A130]